ncbi:hypothetical protein [Jiangella anatolica]|nr:hypothetical protein [Jiangella anatolica]
MATTPTPGQQGYGILTGDPELAAVSAQSGAAPAGPSQDDLSPTAQRWARYWDQKPWTPMSPRFNYRRPGAAGFGVLREQGLGGKSTKSLKPEPEFFVDKKQGGKAGGTLRGADTRQVDRGRLQELADKYYGRPATPTEVAELWGMALGDIDAAEVMGADPEDPWHWIEMRVAQAAETRAEKQGPTTQTQRTINLTDPTTAAAVIDNTLRNLLGRRATDDEREQFMSTLRATEQANPTLSTTTTTYGEDGNTSDSSTTTTGGAPDAGTAAQAFADDELLGEQKAVLAASYYEALRGL